MLMTKPSKGQSTLGRLQSRLGLWYWVRSLEDAQSPIICPNFKKMLLDLTFPCKCCFISQFHFIARLLRRVVYSILFIILLLPLKYTPVRLCSNNFGQIINLHVSKFNGYFSVSSCYPLSSIDRVDHFLFLNTSSLGFQDTVSLFLF